MRKKMFLAYLLVIFLFLNHAAFAQEKIIKLKDGVILRGKIISKEGDIYKISNAMLGVLSVKDSDIASIEETKPAFGDMEAYQQKIINDPRVMESIRSLSSDKEILDMLSDTQLKTAIMNQDVDYLKNNEKFLKFTNNPTVKKIMETVTASNSQNNKSQERTP